MGSLEADRHRRSPSLCTVDNRRRSYLKGAYMKTCDKTPRRCGSMPRRATAPDNLLAEVIPAHGVAACACRSPSHHAGVTAGRMDDEISLPSSLPGDRRCAPGWAPVSTAALCCNWLRVFRSAEAARLGPDGSQQLQTKVGRSEKCVALRDGWGTSLVHCQAEIFC